MSASLRIGVVSYANVAPLVAGLPAGWLRRGVPAQVADWLAAGEVDVGIVPAIELARQQGLRALPDLGIAADGACDSVLLFATRPLRDVRSVALDPSSRTAATLVRILLDREGARDVRYEPKAGRRVEDRLQDHDATLVIGDPALHAGSPAGVARFDLAAEWKRHVGLPFVFALWASPRGRTLDAEDLSTLRNSAEAGLASLPALAEQEASSVGLPAPRVEAYLRQLRYRLDDRYLAGLRAFLDEAVRVGVVASADVELYD